MNQIYYGGTIITMEKEGDTAECVYIEDGRIIAVGKQADVLMYQKADTVMIDLHGHTLLPAFIDAHSHLTAYAFTLGTVDLNGAQSISEVQERIRKYQEENKLDETEWIIGFGYDQNILKEKRHPVKTDLDMFANPVMITHVSGHMGTYNSQAMKRLTIDCNTQDIEGGFIARNGAEPNGYMEERAFMEASKGVPRKTADEMKELFEKAQEVYFSYGITTIQEGLMGKSEFELLAHMEQTGSLQADVIGYVDIKNASELMKQAEAFSNGHFKIGGYKLILDGSPQGKTAWMSHPYEDGTNGYAVYKDSEVDAYVKQAIADSTQILVHCNGDMACEQFIRSVEQNPAVLAYRPVMIHAQLLRKDQLKRCRHIIPSFFIAHTYFWGDVHKKNLGERSDYISPAKTAEELGVLFTFHQDTPVLQPDMLFSIWCAVNRRTKTGTAIGDNEKISPYKALEAVTCNAAYSYFEENEKGSIKQGKWADFVILSDDPCRVDPDTIKDIRILETICKGKSVWSREWVD